MLFWRGSTVAYRTRKFHLTLKVSWGYFFTILDVNTYVAHAFTRFSIGS